MTWVAVLARTEWVWVDNFSQVYHKRAGNAMTCPHPCGSKVSKILKVTSLEIDKIAVGWFCCGSM